MTTIRERAIVGPSHIESEFLPRAAVAWFDESFSDRRELLRALDALMEAVGQHGSCNGPSCNYVTGYHSPECDVDEPLRAAVAHAREVTDGR